MSDLNTPPPSYESVMGIPAASNQTNQFFYTPSSSAKPSVSSTHVEEMPAPPQPGFSPTTVYISTPQTRDEPQIEELDNNDILYGWIIVIISCIVLTLFIPIALSSNTSPIFITLVILVIVTVIKITCKRKIQREK